MPLLSGAFGIDTQTNLFACCLGTLPEFLQLLQGIENNVVTVFQNVLKILFSVCGRKYMIFALDSLLFQGTNHLLRPKPCLVETAGGSAAKHTADQRIQLIHGKCLLRQQYLCSRALHDPL